MENGQTYIIPRYINKPIEWLGMELLDILLVYVGVFYCYIAESKIHTLVTVCVVVWFIRKKRKSPPGHFKHLLYCASLFNPDGYPGFNEQEYVE